MTVLIDTKQVEEYFNAANEAAEKSSKMARGAVIEAIESGQQLNNAKESIPHGEWTSHLAKHWNYTQKTACQYMLLAANFTCGLNLKDAKSINDALRMIADDKAEKDPDPPIVPRSERKPADVKVSIPDDSTRVLDDEGEPDADEVDDDPAPDLPTNRKTAKGSEKVPEGKKPKTAAIVPEIVDEPKDESDPFGAYTFAELLIVLQDKIPDDAAAHKHAAKLLRKAADKLDPPKNGTIPTVEEVAEYAAEQGWKGFNAEKFWNHYDLADWKYGKAKTPLKKWKTAAASAWENGHGWASSTQNGKAQNNGHSNGRTDGSCLGTNGRPEVQKRKIIYQ